MSIIYEPKKKISCNFGGVVAYSNDGHPTRGARVLIEPFNPVPFVVSPSILRQAQDSDGLVECSPERVEGHEWHTLRFLTLRPAQGERILSRNVRFKT